MSVLKNILSLWVCIGAYYAYMTRDVWVPIMREDSKLFAKAISFSAMLFVCLIVAPIFEVVFFVGEKLKFKKRR